MPRLILVRGLPGSGKSTHAADLDAFHIEADYFFIDNIGAYNFDVKLLPAAHEWCYSNTVRFLREGVDVVVSNTFTRLWELEKYLAIPTLLPGVSIEVVEMKTQYQSIHGVPADKIKQMSERWEEITDPGVRITRIWK